MSSMAQTVTNFWQESGKFGCYTTESNSGATL